MKGLEDSKVNLIRACIYDREMIYGDWSTTLLSVVPNIAMGRDREGSVCTEAPSGMFGNPYMKQTGSEPDILRHTPYATEFVNKGALHCLRELIFE